jgi:pimeloyl-ACP methyl ester carboxylesterase
MKFREFGPKDCPTIILLHGGGLSWWSLQGIVDGLLPDYHVVTTIIDGFGEDSDETFISIEDSACKLIQYIDRELGGKVHAIGGLSLGAQIVVELLSQRPDITDFAVIESALVIPMKSTSALMVPMVKLSYGLVRKKWFSRLQAKQMLLPEAILEQYFTDSMKISRESMVNMTLSNGNYPLKDSISQTKAKVLILVGEKELGVMKKSAAVLNKAIPSSTLKLLPGMAHGQFSLTKPKEYVHTIRDFILHHHR